MQLARRLACGEAISIIVDSTGLSFGRTSEWYERKYSHKATRTPWRKMHLSIDTDMNVHGIRITTTEVSESEGMDAVLPADLPVDKVIADGAYYSIERTKALSRAGVTPVIPPPAHAVVHGNDLTRWHDQIVQYIEDKGSQMQTRLGSPCPWKLQLGSRSEYQANYLDGRSSTECCGTAGS